MKSSLSFIQGRPLLAPISGLHVENIGFNLLQLARAKYEVIIGRSCLFGLST